MIKYFLTISGNQEVIQQILQEKNLIIFFENAEIDIGMESVNIIFESEKDLNEEIIGMMEKYSQMMFRLLYYGNLEKIGGIVDGIYGRIKKFEFAVDGNELMEFGRIVFGYYKIKFYKNRKFYYDNFFGKKLFCKELNWCSKYYISHTL